MKPIGIVWILLSLSLLASCGSSDNESNETTAPQATPEQVEQMQKDAQKIIEQQMTKMQQKEAATWPCSLFPQADIEALAGNPLDKGSYAFVNADENGHLYKREACDWSAKGGEGNEVSLWVSLPKHFKSGQVECDSGSGNAATGIGDKAWWDYQKYWGMGTLRVCSSKAMLEVKVTEKSKSEAAAKKIATTMAEKVLTSQ
ncbi:MAG TPA: hypothetical protein VNI58_06495 [Mariprofundaceae bacterium]|nr:hypothetical protein [Mariprofundaceae bacterium]